MIRAQGFFMSPASGGPGIKQKNRKKLVVLANVAMLARKIVRQYDKAAICRAMKV